MNRLINHFPKGFLVLLLGSILFLSGCEQMVVLDPKGPVAQSQKDLIMFAVIFMLVIIVVVYALFAYMVWRFRDRPGRKDDDYDPNIHGNTTIEIIWTAIPLLIIIILAIPTVQTIYELEKPSASGTNEEPLVVYATSADWKWIFSYPEQNIETVNYLHIPTDRDIEFRLSSADSMAALWIPALGGQKYNMAGMQTTLYLQADEPGVYDGRNANFTGEGFANQTFKVHAESRGEFEDWVQTVQEEEPELTPEKYNKLLEPGLTEEMEFSSTHLQWVDHGTNAGRDYSINLHRDAFGEQMHLNSNNMDELLQREGE